MLVKMKKALWGIFKEEDGATALEYAILVVLIAIVMAGGAAFFGGTLSDLFSDTATELDTETKAIPKTILNSGGVDPVAP
ncbi:MAG: Flp family type IVb pilin [Blastopirellula sp.]|nr:MAG: Flp family type IVb pilin [Blastopirellula sp.]